LSLPDQISGLLRGLRKLWVIEHGDLFQAVIDDSPTNPHPNGGFALRALARFGHLFGFGWSVWCSTFDSSRVTFDDSLGGRYTEGIRGFRCSAQLHTVHGPSGHRSFLPKTGQGAVMRIVQPSNKW